MSLNLICQWSDRNLDIIFFIYGLAFVVMGIAIGVTPKKGSQFKFVDILWLFIAYALIHAPADFIDMFSVSKGRSGTFFTIGQTLTFISYSFLFEFGRRLICFTKRVFSWWILPIIVIGIFIVSILSEDFWPTANILVGYFIRFPAGLMAGFGFILYYNLHRKYPTFLKVKKYFYWVSFSLLAWAFFCGIVRLKGTFHPSDWINTYSFSSTVKLPVHVFRAICAAITTWAICGILRIFNLERIEKLYGEISEHKIAEGKLKSAYDQLNQIQSQLIQSEKMASVGQLAAGVAHEINNPLTAISGEVEMLLKYKKTDEDTKRILEIIVEQSQRIKMITERLLVFSHKKEPKRELLDINNTVEKSIALLNYQAKIHGIKIIKQLDSNIPKIFGDTNQLQEVFLNIMLNATQAMGEKGELTVKTSIEKIKENARRKTDIFKQGQEVVAVEFRDTGKGMDEEMLRKVFNPFFTTKQKNTGLGLSISYELIADHKGIIEAYSKLEEGSTFIVKLPISEKGG